MLKADALDLPYLTMEQDEFAENPFVHFEVARAMHPWLARWKLGYVVTDYAAMRDFFAHEERMRMMYGSIVAIMQAQGTAWGNFQERHILSMMGDGHKRLRDVLAPAFTPRAANNSRALMREVINRLLDEWLPRGAFDFEEFASYFPITVMCRLIGAAPDVIPDLRAAMEAIGLSTAMDPRWLPAMQDGVVVMENFVERLIAQRRARPRAGAAPDLLDLLLLTRAEQKISERELADLLIFLFVAGYDTSKNMLTLSFWVLMQRPDMYARAGEDYDYAQKAVEETFRFHSTTSNQRILNEEITYRGVVLEKDAIVWFPLSIATRDERYAQGAEIFDPERGREHRHIGFGLGAHICLGQYIARAQIHEGLHAICRRIKNPRSSGPQGYRPFPGTWGLRGLPITFGAAPADAAV